VKNSCNWFAGVLGIFQFNSRSLSRSFLSHKSKEYKIPVFPVSLPSFLKSKKHNNPGDPVLSRKRRFTRLERERFMGLEKGLDSGNTSYYAYAFYNIIY